MAKQEALLPNTDAICKATVEMSRYKGKYLVRCKDHDGNVWRVTFADPENAHRAFLAFMERLEDAGRELKGMPPRHVRDQANGFYSEK